MSGDNAAMIIKIAANTDQLRKHLAEGSAMITTTTAGMQKLAKSLDGSKLEQRAHNITAALHEVGGATKLTDGEARRLNRTLEEYIDKAARMGKEVPPDILKTRDALASVGDASGRAGPKVNNLRGSLGMFDGVLTSMGINVGPAVTGIGEIGDASGKTAGEVGKLATAGLVLGAGYAGWKIGRMIADFFDLDQKIGNATAKMLGWGDAAGQAAGAKQDTINAAIARGAATTITYAEAIQFMTVAMDKSVKKNAEAGEKLTKQLEEQAAAQKKAAAAAGAHREKIQQLADTLTGTAAIGKAKEMLEAVTRAMRDGVTVAQMSVEAQQHIHKVLGEGYDAYMRQGQDAPEAMKRIWNETRQGIPLIADLGKEFKNLGTQIKIAIPETLKLPQIGVTNGIKGGTKLGEDIGIPTPPPVPPSFWQAMFGDSKAFGQQLTQTIMGAIQGGGSVINAAGSMIGTSLTSGLAAKLTGGIAPMLKGVMGGAVNALLPGLGALLGPLAQKAFEIVSGLFDRNKGRDVVKDFASSMGGFDALHVKLGTLGAAGEQLWIALTQGVGRNNPAQAREAIEAIMAAFDAQAVAASAATAAHVDTSVAITDAQQKALDAVKGMEAEMQSLMQSIANEAPEEVMGVVEAQTRERIAAIAAERDAAQKAIDQTANASAAAAEEAGRVIDESLAAREFVIRVRAQIAGLPDGYELPGDAPGGQPGFAGGTHGRYLDFGMGTNVTLHGRERVMTEAEGRRESSGRPLIVQSIVHLDRRVLAEAMAETVLT